jgi:hypothetical protein
MYCKYINSLQTNEGSRIPPVATPVTNIGPAFIIGVAVARLAPAAVKLSGSLY